MKINVQIKKNDIKTKANKIEIVMNNMLKQRIDIKYKVISLINYKIVLIENFSLR